jgi:hypothetical protein
VNQKFRGKRGWEVLPHSGLVLQTAGLVKDGVRFSAAKVGGRDVLRRVTGVSPHDSSLLPPPPPPPPPSTEGKSSNKRPKDSKKPKRKEKKKERSGKQKTGGKEKEKSRDRGARASSTISAS